MPKAKKCDVDVSESAISIKVLKPELIPERKGNCYYIKAHGGFTLPPRNSCEVDCGIAFKLPENVTVQIETTSEWAKRGLSVQSIAYTKNEWTFVGVVANNIGKQIISFKDATIARLVFVNTLPFELVTE